jgi:uncharacterized protein (DUF697 family)
MPINDTTELILKHVGAAMAAAAATPVPLVGIAAVAVIQVALVRRLARHYGVEYDVVRGRAAVLAVAGASLARVGANAVKSLPGGGWLLGGATQAALSGASTYALGEVYREHFARNGTLDALDGDALRARYREALERRREVARKLRRSMRNEAVAPDEHRATRERLERLRRTGVLTQAEFERLVEPTKPEVG